MKTKTLGVISAIYLFVTVVWGPRTLTRRE
jgi:hypothetical protein